MMAAVPITSPFPTATKLMIKLVNNAPRPALRITPASECRRVTVFVVECWKHKVYEFSVPNDTNISKLIQTYRRISGRERHILSFWHNGKRVWSHQTPWQLAKYQKSLLIEVLGPQK